MRENTTINDTIKALRNAVQSSKACSFAPLELCIRNEWRILNYFGDRFYRIPCFESIRSNRFTITQLKLLYEDLRSIQDQQDKIPKVLFKNYLHHRQLNYEDYPQIFY